jgi:N-glycosylase/DNA lyase
MEIDFNKEILDTYSKIKNEILDRLSEFKDQWSQGNNDYAFSELAFCLFTPQSKAKLCWTAISKIISNSLIFNGSSEDIMPFMVGVRFKKKKSQYLVEARSKFYDNFDFKSFISSFNNSYLARDWLVTNIKGYGYKEATHYLRNIGLVGDLAILDRHILKNLKRANVIKEIPSSISKNKYLEIEKAMQKYAKDINISMDHLDFVLWYREAGEIFK